MRHSRGHAWYICLSRRKSRGHETCENALNCRNCHSCAGNTKNLQRNLHTFDSEYSLLSQIRICCFGNMDLIIYYIALRRQRWICELPWHNLSCEVPEKASSLCSVPLCALPHESVAWFIRNLHNSSNIWRPRVTHRNALFVKPAVAHIHM